MDKFEALSVQSLALKCREQRVATALFSIHGITDERMAERQHVHANLVRAAGLKAAAQQRCMRKMFEHLVMRDRRAAPRRYRHARALHRMAAYRRLDFATTRDPPVDERQLLTLHCTGL